jgi:putative hydrolase of the HAD superfamily
VPNGNASFQSAKSCLIDSGGQFINLLRMNTPTYDVLFFDLDGTLWDFEANADIALEIIYLKYGIATHCPRFHKFSKVYKRENTRLWALYRKGLVQKTEVSHGRFERTLRSFGADTTKVPEIAEDFLEQLALQSILLDGALEVLDYLKTKYRLAIITNGFEEVQYKKMTASGLLAYFEKVITSEHAKALKPARAIFDLAMAEMQTTADRSLMIGDDHTADIQGARQSGLAQVWLTRAAKPRGKASYVISDLRQLLTIAGL